MADQRSRMVRFSSEARVNSDVEIWRTAHDVIRQCGSDADPRALAIGMSSKMLAIGQSDDAALWDKITRAIVAILADDPDPGSIPRSIQ